MFSLSIKPSGVALYVRNHLSSKLSPRLLDTNVDSVFNKIQVGNIPCLVGSLFRLTQMNVSTHEIIVKHIEKLLILIIKASSWRTLIQIFKKYYVTYKKNIEMKLSCCFI